MTALADKLISHLDVGERKKLSKLHINTLKKFDEYNRRKHLAESTRDCQFRIISAFAREIGKNFKQMTKKDIEAYFDGLKVKSYTIEHRRLIVVKFFKWLYNKEKPPEIVRGLEPNKGAYDKEIPPSKLWSDEDTKQLIMAFTHPRDKAITAVLYDGEPRVGEILSMDIKDCQIEGETVSIFLPTSKTQRRRVGLIFSVPYLLDWLNHHPRRDEPDAPLWISLSNRTYGERLSDSAVYDILKKGQKRSGIDKHIHPHLLRHSMASKLRKAGLPDALHRRRMGLARGSMVIERYTHLDDQEVHVATQKALGITPKEEVEQSDVLLPQACFRCGAQNSATTKYCHKCHTALDIEFVERDLNILELFKSKFTELAGLDIDKMLCEYQRFKSETSQIQIFLNCFTDSDVIETDVLRQKLPWDDDQVLELLSYLVSAELIEINNGEVHLLGRQKAKQYIVMQKRYLEVKT